MTRVMLYSRTSVYQPPQDQRAYVERKPLKMFGHTFKSITYVRMYVHVLGRTDNINRLSCTLSCMLSCTCCCCYCPTYVRMSCLFWPENFAVGPGNRLQGSVKY